MPLWALGHRLTVQRFRLIALPHITRVARSGSMRQERHPCKSGHDGESNNVGASQKVTAQAGYTSMSEVGRGGVSHPIAAPLFLSRQATEVSSIPYLTSSVLKIVCVCSLPGGCRIP